MTDLDHAKIITYIVGQYVKALWEKSDHEPHRAKILEAVKNARDDKDR